MNGTRFGMLWGQWVLRDEFNHRFYLKFRAQNKHVERKIPEKGLEEDNEIFHKKFYIKFTKWTPAKICVGGDDILFR